LMFATFVVLARRPPPPPFQQVDAAHIVAGAVNTSGHDLKACEEWARRPLPGIGDGLCPLKTARGDRAAQLGNDVYAVPPDAVVLCSFVEALQNASMLPHPDKHATGLLVDVGAAFGGELMVGSALGFAVASFEAREAEYSVLQSSYGNLSNVRITNAAVSNVGAGASHRLKLYNAGDSSSLHKTAISGRAESRKARSQAAKVLSVPAIELDYAFRSQLDGVSVLKIDVQGAEFEVLASGIQMMLASRPSLTFEYSPKFRSNGMVARSLCLLRSLGIHNCHITDHQIVRCVPRPPLLTRRATSLARVMSKLKQDLDGFPGCVDDCARYQNT